MDMHRLKNGGDKKEGDASSQTSSLRKRKKNNDHSKASSGYLQEWVHQSRSFMTPAPHYDPHCNQLVGPYWEVAGSPRMFAAFSDPSVCRYSVPSAPPPSVAYSYEPVSLPIYQPAYQPPMHPSSIGAWRSPQHVRSRTTSKHDSPKRPIRPHTSRVSKQTVKMSMSSCNTSNSPRSQHPIHHGATTQEEYLSLPPGTQHECDLDDSHRRFSDPGLARTEADTVPENNGNNNNNNVNNNHNEEVGSEDWAHDSSSSSNESINYETVALSEQLNLLKADNKRLAQELRDTRAELHKLKLQAATWGTPIQQDYQPGMIADLVREIRDAAQLREETLLSRLRVMMAEGGVLRLTSSHDKENSNSNHIREPSMNSQDSSAADDFKDSDRISRLERQLNSMQLHNGGDVSRREEQLRRELQEAQAARKMAESNVNKLEKLMNMMKKKMNGVSVDDGRAGGGERPASPASPSSLESLTSGCSSSHGTPAAPAAPAGPVTDL